MSNQRNSHRSPNFNHTNLPPQPKPTYNSSFYNPAFECLHEYSPTKLANKDNRYFSKTKNLWNEVSILHPTKFGQYSE